MAMNKNEQLHEFSKLPLKQRKAIIAMVENNGNLEDIRKSVHVGRTAFYNWRTKDADFIEGLHEYSSHYLGQASAKAVHKLVKLIDHNNPYVALQSSLAVINLAGLGSTDNNVELDKANIRKSNAEAEIAEQKAKLLRQTDDKESAQMEQIIKDIEKGVADDD